MVTVIYLPVRSFCYENFIKMNDIYINGLCYLLEESDSVFLGSSVVSLKFGGEKRVYLFLAAIRYSLSSCLAFIILCIHL